jgi:hypothetical protein
VRLARERMTPEDLLATADYFRSLVRCCEGLAGWSVGKVEWKERDAIVTLHPSCAGPLGKATSASLPGALREALSRAPTLQLRLAEVEILFHVRAKAGDESRI